MLLKQSTARNKVILMVDASDSKSGKTGLTLAVKLSKNGAAFATITPTVTELEAGLYTLGLTTSHTDTLGDFALHITGSGADPTDTVDQIFADFPATQAQVQVAVATELDTPVTELSSVPGSNYSARDAIKFIFQYLRNRRTATSATETLFKGDSATPLGTATVGEDGTTFAKGKMG